MPLPAQILNDLFVRKTDNDMEAVTKMVRNYVKDRIYAVFLKSAEKDQEGDFSGVPDNLDIRFDKTAGRITLSISGVHRGKKVKGTKNWTEMEILASARAVTENFDDLIFNVFKPDDKRLRPKDGILLS